MLFNIESWGPKVIKVVKKHMPLILTTTGTAGLIVTAGLTYKSAEKLHEFKEEVKEIESEGLEMSRRDYILGVTKIFALPVSVGLLSTGAIFGSYMIQNNRIEVLSTALGTVGMEYKKYRQKYAETYGKEEEEEFFTRVRQETIEDANGKEKVVKVADKSSVEAGVWFSQSTQFTESPQYNIAYVQECIREIDQKRFVRGHITLNDVLEIFGIRTTRTGALLGWNSSFMINFKVMNELVDPETGHKVPDIFIDWDMPTYIYGDGE